MAEDLEDQLSKIIVVTLNEATDQELGGEAHERKHDANLAIFHNMLRGQNIKSVGYDIDFSGIRSSGLSDLYSAIMSVDIPTVFPVDNDLTLSLPYKKLEFTSSHARFWPTKLYEVEKRDIDVRGNWLNPDTVLVEFETGNHPELGITFASSVLKASGNSKPHPEYFKISYMSENNIRKVSLQDLLKGRVPKNILSGKYVLVGFDYENLDVFSTLTQGKVNGVFVHALLLAASLHSNSQSVEIMESTLPDTPPF